MPLSTILEHYATEALERATYKSLEDGSFVGRVPELKGVIAFGCNREECATELFSVIEDWALFRARAGQAIPVLGSVDLNTEEGHALAQY